MFEGMYNFSASNGPPERKGDATVGTKSLAESMKVGLRAYYAKKGQIPSRSSVTSLMYEADAAKVQRETPTGSPMKDALKTGLRAWYAKHGNNRPLHETTLVPNVGARLPERRLGTWGGGAPSRRRHFNLPKGGTSLRCDIQNLEKSLEATLATLSNNKRLSEADKDEFAKVLLDAIFQMVNSGHSNGLKDAKMHATLIEGSDYIGAPAPETAEVLTHKTDKGLQFAQIMGEETSGPIVEMISNQLTSGMPLALVQNNVAAALQSTSSPSVRSTLLKAAKVLSGM